MPLPWKLGPTPLTLGHGVELKLPENYQFLGQPEAGQVMTQLGNLNNDNLLGIVVSSEPEPEGQGQAQQDDSYLIVLSYDEEGYIKDDETLDSDEILKAIRDGEEEYNKQRKQAGFPPIHAEGWREQPHYDKAKHQVIWGLTIRSQDDTSVNYNTRVLGRKGYVSVNLVTGTMALQRHMPAATTILAGTTFGSGSRYEDFDEKNDKVAEYGLTGLVLGGVGLGVAKLVKIGLLAKFGKVLIAALIAGKKLIFAALAAGVVGLRKLFGKRNDETQA
ncbi:MAG: hypothetical protein RL701_2894 [Pseudomonadota bacterium]